MLYPWPAGDGHLRVHLGHLLAEREEAEAGLGLGLDAGRSLEARFGVAYRRGPKPAELVLERWVGAGEPLVALQLAEEVGAPEVGADGQTALDVGQASVCVAT